VSGIHGDGRTISGPGFAYDDGSADAAVEAALAAYASGSGGEHAVVAALAESRLLVPVIAVADGTEPAASEAGPRQGSGAAEAGSRQGRGAAKAGLRQETGADMALPTLVGRDGRRAVPAFTSAATIAAWRADARPVPIATPDVCAAALSEDAAAVIVDVAGPVPITISGPRLAALASGTPPPPPERDPEILAALHAATSAEPSVRRVRVLPATDADLSVDLELTTPAPDHAALAHRIATHLTTTLPGRLPRGVAFTITPA
jgi:hypothetical protein